MLAESLTLENGLLLTAALLGLLLVWPKISHRGHRRKSRASEVDGGELAAAIAPGGTLQEVQSRLDQLTAAMGAQIDPRIERLEALVREADQRILRLSGLAEGARDEPRVRPEQTPGPDDTPERVRKIYQLVDSGMSPIRTAEELNVPLGEVELVLNLRSLT